MKKIVVVARLLVGASALGVSPVLAEAAPPPKISASLDPFSGMKYRLVGPFRGGRVSAVAGVAQQPNTYYFGAAAGGVWKTTDGGVNWEPLWDKLPEASPSIGAIVVAPSNPNIIYVGTGEGNLRGNVVTGNGVYKSVDAGKTWQFIGLRDSGAIGRMAVSPTDPNVVFVAAIGHPFGNNPERGIYRTRDGGKTWQRTLYVNDKTGGIDVQISPANPNIVYAGMYEVLRQPWMFTSGGAGSGLYRSDDGGTTWARLSGNGLPAGVLGRIGVAPTIDKNRVYALIEAEKGGLYRTDDGGQSWKLINSDNNYKQRAWYYTNVFADPKDPNTVFITNTGAYKSADAGVTFKKLATFHGDNHQIWINPLDTSRMVNGNDGGADVSVDGGKSWSSEMNQPTAQFYHVAVDNQTPYHLYGAQQDNTTVVTAAASVRGPIGVESWHSAGGGESGYVIPDPKDPDVTIANGYGGNVTRFDQKTGQLYTISPWPHEVMGWAPKDLLHRSQWTEPLAFSPHNPNVLYNANEVLFRSDDSGKTWTTISPDLTRNDKSKQLSSGGPLTKDNTGIETYDTIFSVVESPAQKGLIWAGTDDGLVQLTRDGGAHWENVTPKAMPEWGTVDMIEADPHKPGVAYIAVDCHRLDDFRPHAFRTDDYGKTWVSITAGIPVDAYVHAVRVDPARPGLLYAGTENGIFTSFDDGAHWEPFQLNLPRVPVHDLIVHGSDLVVATHGRAFWVLDDLSPIRQWSDAIANEDMHFFEPRQTVRIQYTGRGDMTGRSVGQNPPQGVILYYWLKTGSKPDAEVAHAKETADRKKLAAENEVPGRVKLEIIDSTNKVIRTILQKKEDAVDDEEEGRRHGPTLTDAAGLNRFAWDMHTDGPVEVPHSALWHATLSGPVVPPGHYTARLTVDGKSKTQPIDIVPNPALTVTQAQLERQFQLNVDVNDELNQVQDAILEIRMLHKKLAEVKTGASSNARLARAADVLDQNATAIEDKLVQRKSVASEDPLNFPIRLNNQLASLSTTISQGDTEPSRPEYEEFDQLKARAVAVLGEWRQFKSTDLATFNATLDQMKMKRITLAVTAELKYERAAYGEGTQAGNTAADEDE
ncbi:MAG TPA: hypothetical protein VGU01_11950 [Sphingomicrobium sp.]|nr:hypothetical protein [Sphingomicrobium sp.]